MNSHLGYIPPHTTPGQLGAMSARSLGPSIPSWFRTCQWTLSQTQFFSHEPPVFSGFINASDVPTAYGLPLFPTDGFAANGPMTFFMELYEVETGPYANIRVRQGTYDHTYVIYCPNGSLVVYPNSLTPVRPFAGLGDSPAIAMPNGQPTPSAAIVKEAQAALGFALNTSTLGLANVISALSPAWTQADVDGVYGARTQQMLAGYQAVANTVGSPLTYGPVDASDGSLTTGGSVGETSLSTLDSLRYFVRSNGSTSYWGQTIQAPQFLTSNQSPLPAPLVPVTPGAPSATTTTSTPMSTGAKVAIGVGVVAALALAGWGVHHAMSAQQGASSATAKTKVAPRARRTRR